MQCRVLLLPWPVPGEVGLLALSCLQFWPWSASIEVQVPAEGTDQCLALLHPGALDHVVPTRVPGAVLARILPRVATSRSIEARSRLRRAGAVVTRRCSRLRLRVVILVILRVGITPVILVRITHGSLLCGTPLIILGTTCRGPGSGSSTAPAPARPQYHPPTHPSKCHHR